MEGEPAIHAPLHVVVVQVILTSQRRGDGCQNGRRDGLKAFGAPSRVSASEGVEVMVGGDFRLSNVDGAIRRRRRQASRPSRPSAPRTRTKSIVVADMAREPRVTVCVRKLREADNIPEKLSGLPGASSLSPPPLDATVTAAGAAQQSASTRQLRQRQDSSPAGHQKSGQA